jgi:hypothetical protein
MLNDLVKNANELALISWFGRSKPLASKKQKLKVSELALAEGLLNKTS